MKKFTILWKKIAYKCAFDYNKLKGFEDLVIPERNWIRSWMIIHFGTYKLPGYFFRAFKTLDISKMTLNEKIPADEDISEMKTAFAAYMNDNFLLEGGNAVGGEPIQGNAALDIANDIIKKIKDKLPYTAIPVGSAGKKDNTMTSSDIDIAIKMPFEKGNDLLKVIKELTNDANLKYAVYKGFKLLSVLYPYTIDGNLKNIQVDFFLCDDLSMAAYFHHSPMMYGSNASKFKGDVRTMMLIAIASQIPVPGKQNTFFEGSDYPKDIWKYSLSMDGLKLIHQSFEGKQGQMLKNKKTIHKDDKIISKNPTYITKFLLGSKASVNDANSLESICNFINDDNKFSHIELLDKIKDKFLENVKNSLKDEKRIKDISDYINEGKLPEINEGFINRQDSENTINPDKKDIFSGNSGDIVLKKTNDLNNLADQLENIFKYIPILKNRVKINKNHDKYNNIPYLEIYFYINKISYFYVEYQNGTTNIYFDGLWFGINNFNVYYISTPFYKKDIFSKGIFSQFINWLIKLILKKQGNQLFDKCTNELNNAFSKEEYIEKRKNFLQDENINDESDLKLNILYYFLKTFYKDELSIDKVISGINIKIAKDFFREFTDINPDLLNEGFINKQKAENSINPTEKNVFSDNSGDIVLKKTGELNNLADQFENIFKYIPFLKGRIKIDKRYINSNSLSLFFYINKISYFGMEFYKPDKSVNDISFDNFAFIIGNDFNNSDYFYMQTSFDNKDIFSKGLFSQFIDWIIKLISKNQDNQLFDKCADEFDRVFYRTDNSKKIEEFLQDKDIDENLKTKYNLKLNIISYFLKIFYKNELQHGFVSTINIKIVKDFIKKFMGINPDLLNEGFINRQKDEDNINPIEKNVFSNTSKKITLERTDDLNNLADQFENIFKYIPILKSSAKIDRHLIEYNYLSLFFYINKVSYINTHFSIPGKDKISFQNLSFGIGRYKVIFYYMPTPVDKDIFSKGLFDQFINLIITLISKNQGNQLYNKLTDEFNKIFFETDNSERIKEFLQNKNINETTLKHIITNYILKITYKRFPVNDFISDKDIGTAKDFFREFTDINPDLLNEGFINKQKAEDSINPTEKNVFSDSSKEIVLNKTDDLNNLADQLENIFKSIPFFKNKIDRIKIDRELDDLNLLDLIFYISKTFILNMEFRKDFQNNEISFWKFTITIGNKSDPNEQYVESIYNNKTPFDDKIIFSKNVFSQFINCMIKLISKIQNDRLLNKFFNELNTIFSGKSNLEKIKRFMQNEDALSAGTIFEIFNLKEDILYYYIKVHYRDFFSIEENKNVQKLKIVKDFLKEFTDINPDLLNEGFINKQKADDSINPDKKDIFSGNSGNIVLKRTDDLNNLADQFENIFKYIPVLKDRIKIDKYHINIDYLDLIFYVNKVSYFRIEFFNNNTTIKFWNINFRLINNKANISYATLNTLFDNKDIFSKGVFSQFIDCMIKLISGKDNQLFAEFIDELNKIFSKTENSKKIKKFLQSKNIDKGNLQYYLLYYLSKVFYKGFFTITGMTDPILKIVKDFIKEFMDINPDLLNEGFINRHKSEDSINSIEKDIFSGNSGEIVLKKTDDINNLTDQFVNIFKYIPIFKGKTYINKNSSNISDFYLIFCLNKSICLYVEFYNKNYEKNNHFRFRNFWFGPYIINDTNNGKKLEIKETYIVPTSFDNKDIFSEGLFGKFVNCVIKLIAKSQNNQILNKFTEEFDKVFSKAYNPKQINKFLRDEKNTNMKKYDNLKLDIIYYFLRAFYKEFPINDIMSDKDMRTVKDFLKEFMDINPDLLNEGFINRQKSDDSINPPEKNIFSDSSKEIVLKKTGDLNNLADQFENIFKYMPFLKGRIKIYKHDINIDYLYLYFYINKISFLEIEFYKNNNNIYFNNFAFEIGDKDNFSYDITTPFDDKIIFSKGLFNQFIDWLVKFIYKGQDNKLFNIFTNEFYTAFNPENLKNINKFLQDKNIKNTSIKDKIIKDINIYDLKLDIVYYFLRTFYKDECPIDNQITGKDFKLVKDFFVEFMDINPDFLNEGFINRRKSEDIIGPTEKDIFSGNSGEILLKRTKDMNNLGDQLENIFKYMPVLKDRVKIDRIDIDVNYLEIYLHVNEISYFIIDIHNNMPDGNDICVDDILFGIGNEFYNSKTHISYSVLATAFHDKDIFSKGLFTQFINWLIKLISKNQGNQLFDKCTDDFDRVFFKADNSEKIEEFLQNENINISIFNLKQYILYYFLRIFYKGFFSIDNAISDKDIGAAKKFLKEFTDINPDLLNEGFINKQKSEDSISPDKKNIFSGNSGKIILKKTNDLNNLADQFENIFKYMPVLKDRVKIDKHDINVNYLYLYFYINKISYIGIVFKKNNNIIFNKFHFYVGNINNTHNISSENITTPFNHRNIFAKRVFSQFISWLIKLISENKNNQLFNKFTEEFDKVFFKADNSEKFTKFLQDKNMRNTSTYFLTNVIYCFALRIFYKGFFSIDNDDESAKTTKLVKDFLKEFTDINPDLLNEGFINRQNTDDSINPDKKDIFSGNSGDIVLKKTNDLNNLADQFENIFKYIPVLKGRIKFDKKYHGYLYLYFYINKISTIEIGFRNDNDNNILAVDLYFGVGEFNNDYSVNNHSYPILTQFKNKDIFSKGWFNRLINWIIKILFKSQDNQLFNKFTDKFYKIFIKTYKNNKYPDQINKFLMDEKADTDADDLEDDIMFYFLDAFYKNNLSANHKTYPGKTKTIKDFIKEFMGINPDLLNEGFINRQKVEDKVSPTEKNIFSDTSKEITLKKTNDLNNIADQFADIFNSVPFFKNKVKISKFNIDINDLNLKFYLNKITCLAVEFHNNNGHISFENTYFLFYNINYDGDCILSYDISSYISFNDKDVFSKGLFSQFINWLIKLMSKCQNDKLFNKFIDEYDKVFLKSDYKETIDKFLHNENTKNAYVFDLRHDILIYYLGTFYKDFFMIDNKKVFTPENIRLIKVFTKKFMNINFDFLNEGFINRQKVEDKVNPAQKNIFSGNSGITLKKTDDLNNLADQLENIFKYIPFFKNKIKIDKALVKNNILDLYFYINKVSLLNVGFCNDIEKNSICFTYVYFESGIFKKNKYHSFTKSTSFSNEDVFSKGIFSQFINWIIKFISKCQGSQLFYKFTNKFYKIFIETDNSDLIKKFLGDTTDLNIFDFKYKIMIYFLSTFYKDYFSTDYKISDEYIKVIKDFIKKFMGINPDLLNEGFINRSDSKNNKFDDIVFSKTFINKYAAGKNDTKEEIINHFTDIINQFNLNNIFIWENHNKDTFSHAESFTIENIEPDYFNFKFTVANNGEIRIWDINFYSTSYAVNKFKMSIYNETDMYILMDLLKFFTSKNNQIFYKELNDTINSKEYNDMIGKYSDFSHQEFVLNSDMKNRIFDYLYPNILYIKPDTYISKIFQRIMDSFIKPLIEKYNINPYEADYKTITIY